MYGDVHRYCRACLTCSSHNSTGRQHSAPLQPIPVSGPFQRFYRSQDYEDAADRKGEPVSDSLHGLSYEVVGGTAWGTCQGIVRQRPELIIRSYAGGMQLARHVQNYSDIARCLPLHLDHALADSSARTL